MKEKDLTSKLLRQLKKISESWWYKIPDPSRCPKCGCIAMVSKRPFDLIGCVRGYPVAVELKTSSIAHVASHQEAHLRLFSIAGGLPFVYLPDRLYFVEPSGAMNSINKDLKKFLDDRL